MLVLMLFIWLVPVCAHLFSSSELLTGLLVAICLLVPVGSFASTELPVSMALLVLLGSLILSEPLIPIGAPTLINSLAPTGDSIALVGIIIIAVLIVDAGLVFLFARLRRKYLKSRREKTKT
jgi:hypothetical protein